MNVMKMRSMIKKLIVVAIGGFLAAAASAQTNVVFQDDFEVFHNGYQNADGEYIGLRDQEWTYNKNRRDTSILTSYSNHYLSVKMDITTATGNNWSGAEFLTATNTMGLSNAGAGERIRYSFDVVGSEDLGPGFTRLQVRSGDYSETWYNASNGFEVVMDNYKNTTWGSVKLRVRDGSGEGGFSEGTDLFDGLYVSGDASRVWLELEKVDADTINYTFGIDGYSFSTNSGAASGTYTGSAGFADRFDSAYAGLLANNVYIQNDILNCGINIDNFTVSTATNSVQTNILFQDDFETFHTWYKNADGEFIGLTYQDWIYIRSRRGISIVTPQQGTSNNCFSAQMDITNTTGDNWSGPEFLTASNAMGFNNAASTGARMRYFFDVAGAEAKSPDFTRLQVRSGDYSGIWYNALYGFEVVMDVYKNTTWGSVKLRVRDGSDGGGSLSAGVDLFDGLYVSGNARRVWLELKKIDADTVEYSFGIDGYFFSSNSGSVSGTYTGSTGFADRFDTAYAGFLVNNKYTRSDTDECGIKIDNFTVLAVAIPVLPADISISTGIDSVVISSDNLSLGASSNVLQATGNLVAPSWNNIAVSAGTASTNWVISPVADPEMFYRVQSYP